MTRFDYVIVGAGPAGCVLANRLSADPAGRRAARRGGRPDTNPLIAMPRGFGELLGDPATAWHYPTRPFGPSRQVEYWVRGKTLGGSSAVNGMVYNRGHRADYDALERLGRAGAGTTSGRCSRRSRTTARASRRGRGGPLRVSTAEGADPLLEDVITAGTELGWRRTRDLNETDEERIGYAMATIRDGRRVSAADAFLHPVVRPAQPDRRLDTIVDRVLLEGGDRRASACAGAGRRSRPRRARGDPRRRAPSPRPRSSSSPASAPPTRCGRPASTSWSTARTSAPACASTACSCSSSGSRRTSATTGRSATGGRRRRSTGRAGAGRWRARVRHRRLLQDPPGARPPRRPDPDRAVLDRCRSNPAQPLADRAGAGHVCVGYILRPGQRGQHPHHLGRSRRPAGHRRQLLRHRARPHAVGVFRGMRRLFATEPLA